MTLITELFSTEKAIVGMIHVGALPGTPYSSKRAGTIVEEAVGEAVLLAEHGFDAILIENMHDRPYMRQKVGPEVVASMAAVVDAVRRSVDLPLGVQVLAGANHEALAVAMAAGASFIRAENFVFAHVADEGLMSAADAGSLLRYRREIGAEHVRIFADIKKKHASHSITADIRPADAARAAAFFGAEALVVTGVATGEATAPADVRDVGASVELPIAVGSGVTPDNLRDLWEYADAFIVGSYFKHDGVWSNPPDADRIDALMRSVGQLRGS